MMEQISEYFEELILTNFIKNRSRQSLMGKLPVIVHFCDTNRQTYGSETYQKLLPDPRFHVEKWNCLSASADNCGTRCQAYCSSSPYVVVGDKATGTEISANNHEELLQRLLEYLKQN